MLWSGTNNYGIISECEIPFQLDISETMMYWPKQEMNTEQGRLLSSVELQSAALCHRTSAKYWKNVSSRRFFQSVRGRKQVETDFLVKRFKESTSRCLVLLLGPAARETTAESSVRVKDV